MGSGQSTVSGRSNQHDSDSDNSLVIRSRYYIPNYSQPHSTPTYTPQRSVQAPQPQYTPGEEPWRTKIQKPYDTKKDKQRLGHWFPGGSVTVTEKEKRELDEKRTKNRKK